MYFKIFKKTLKSSVRFLDNKEMMVAFYFITLSTISIPMVFS